MSVVWNTTGEAGDNRIWVIVDPSDSVKEPDQGNNQANRSIFVGAPNILHILHAQTDRTVYLENEDVLIACIVQNASGNISVNVPADIEKPDGITDNITLIEGITGNYNGIFANTSLSGIYNITIYANRTGFIDDNESLSFEVLDTIPPASITNITHTTDTTWINWTWDNPGDPDFDHTLIYLNGTWKTATSNNYYLAEGLNASTEYEIKTRTVDTKGNINATWINHTARTALKEITPTPKPKIPRKPIAGKLEIVLIPENPTINDNVSMEVRLTYPTAGYKVEFGNVSIQNNTITVNINSEEPKGMAAQVITTYSEKYDLVFVEEGVYTCEVFINGALAYVKRFGVNSTGSGNVSQTAQTSQPLDILYYYNTHGTNPNIIETTDLLKAADDWSRDIAPPGFTVPITTVQLLALADEWSKS